MNKSLHKLLPVLFGFFVMGFCDVVGISTSYVQQDFGLSETLAGFIPSMVFIWFLLLSIPAALAMNRLGRKNMVQISNGITAVGMLIPFVHYNLATCMTAFVLLGIGNTILQVSLNPLLTNVVFGVQKIDPNLMDAARTMGASSTQVFYKVMVPSAVPYLMNGVKVGLGVGWMCIVAAELYAPQLGGIGYYLSTMATNGLWPNAFAAIVVIAILGILTTGLAEYIHKVITRRMGMSNV